jgi:hypothetical protein
MNRTRPAGITTTVILGLLFIILSVLRSAGLLLRGGLANLLGREQYGSYTIALGVWELALAIILLVLVYGLWTGEHWSWTLGIVIGVIDLLSNLVSLAFEFPRSVVGILLSLLFLYYLTRPKVRAYLGTGAPPASDVQQPQ